MARSVLGKTVSEYANRLNAGVHRETMVLGLVSALVWGGASSGVFAIMSQNSAMQHGTAFKTEWKRTMDAYGHSIWIVASALLLFALVSGELKYLDSRREAKRMAKHIIKRACANMSSRDLLCFANLTLENMSDIQRKEILDAGIALRAEIDKYDAQWMNMQITFVQKRRLVSAAMIKYTNDVAKMIENNEVIELLNSIKNNMYNDTFVVRNGQFIAKQK